MSSRNSQYAASYAAVRPRSLIDQLQPGWHEPTRFWQRTTRRSPKVARISASTNATH